MRAGPLLILLVGCGRVSFDGTADGSPDGDLLTYRSAVLGDGPAGYWRLADPAASSVARDETGNVDGTYVGTCPHGVAGLLAGDSDGAAQFGTGCYVNLGDNFAFTGNAPFTLEALLSQTTPDGYQFLVSKGTRNQNDPIDGYTLLVWPNGVYAERAAGLVNVQTSDTGIEVARTYHLAMVYDGASILLYVDGVMTVPVVPNAAALPAYTAETRIGAASTGGYNVFGVIDEVAIYDKVLSAEQLATHADIVRNGPR